MAMLILSSCSGLIRLSEYGKEMAQQERLMRQQEEVFRRLKEDIEAGNIEVGIDSHEIAKRYALPQIRRFTDEGDEEWIYKPRTEIGCSEAIYLYFRVNRLMEWKMRP